MGDLIERDKIYEAVYDLACKSVGVIGGISEDYAYGLREAAHMIEEAPAVEAVPVVHGRWIKINKYDMESRLYCSSCKQEYNYIDGICYLVSGSELPFYCPNCGTKMDGERDAK